MNANRMNPPQGPALHDKDTGLPPVKYGEFKSLAEVMTEDSLAEIHYSNRVSGNRTTAMLMQAFGNHETLEELLEHLREMGFRRVQNDIQAGSSAIVLVGHDHQFVRVVGAQAKEAPRSKEPFMLQPIAHETVTLSGNKKFCIEVLPEVVTLGNILRSRKVAAEMHMGEDVLGRAAEMMKMLNVSCKAKGMMLWDPGPYNIAVVLNEKNEPVPLILDPGAVMNEEKVGDRELNVLFQRFEGVPKLFVGYEEAMSHQGELDRLEAGDMGCMRDYVNQLATGVAAEPKYYADAQEAHLQRLDLSEGEVANVLTAAQLEARKADYVQQHDAAKAAYEKQCGDAQPQVQSSPLQAEYQPQHSLKYRLLEEGVTPNELRSMGQEMQKEALPGTFCERLAAVAARRGVHKHPHDGGLYER